MSFSHNARFYGDVQGGRRAFDEGSTWVVPAGQAHGSDNQNAHNTSLEYITLFFSQRAISQTLDIGSSESSSGFEFTNYKSRRLSSAIQTLAASMVQHLDDAIIDSAAFDVLDQLRRADGPTATRLPADPVPTVVRIQHFIQDNLSKKLTLEDIQALSDRSLTATRECFRRATGMPMHAYIMAARAERARQLIGPRSDLSEIALRVGLSDQSHLNRLFKNYFAVTPGQYRAGL